MKFNGENNCQSCESKKLYNFELNNTAANCVTIRNVKNESRLRAFRSIISVGTLLSLMFLKNNSASE